MFRAGSALEKSIDSNYDALLGSAVEENQDVLLLLTVLMNHSDPAALASSDSIVQYYLYAIAENIFSSGNTEAS